jgi:hypothetical protein
LGTIRPSEDVEDLSAIDEEEPYVTPLKLKKKKGKVR